MSVSEKRVLLLKDLAAAESRRLEAQSDLQSFCGFSYPEAQSALGTKPGEEVDHLERLADWGYLARQFFDKVHLCPFCSHYALSLRETCAWCGSANTSMVQMLHHFRCGHVDAEPHFRQGVRSVCPKCGHKLGYVGVDYERPNKNYLCSTCQHIFIEPSVSCRCLNCRETFDVSKATTRTLYTYRLSEKGALAAARGRIEEEDSSGTVIDGELAVYTFRFFEERLVQEVRSAQRYEKPVAVMLASPDSMVEYRKSLGDQAAAVMWKFIVRVVKECLRDCDVPAYFEDRTLAVLMPETSLQGAYVAAERIRNRVAEMEPGDWKKTIAISIGIADLSDRVDDAEKLLERAKERLREGKQASGSSIVPAKEEVNVSAG